jgi:type II secretory ATPase GspE/PulE/Tfp pilus assembly ATPase PilB-like protein
MSDLGRPIRDILIDRGHITASQWDEAARLNPQNPAQVLMDRGLLSPSQLARARAARMGLEFVELASPPDPSLQDALPPSLRGSGLCLVIDDSPTETTVAVADPEPTLRDALREAVRPKALRLVVVTPEVLPPPSEGDEAAGAAQEAEEDAALRDLASSSVIVRTFDQIIQRAIDVGASDVHIVNTGVRCEAQYRIDGMLQSLMPIQASYMPGIISRVKILAGLDISQHFVPQSGKIPWPYTARVPTHDLRVEVSPDTSGEHVVIRILGQSSRTTLDDLGFTPDIREGLERIAELPYGLVLLCGPTGSGKSTTLAVLLRLIRDRFPGKRIYTIENPVEHRIPGLIQMQVSDTGPVTFATMLRSVLRQDPDVIMVGEIRDPETAEVSVQAALTGHLVLSTLHTNTAPGAVPRLINLRVDPYLLGQSLQAVLSQRLVRRVCTACAREAPLDGRDLEFARQHGLPETEMRGAGCERCFRTGFRGRLAIGELMILTPAVRARLTRHVSEEELREWTQTPTLTENGLAYVRRGMTTISELRRAAWVPGETPIAPAGRETSPGTEEAGPAPAPVATTPAR